MFLDLIVNNNPPKRRKTGICLTIRVKDLERYLPLP
jgi:hypothetical protein